MSDSPAKLLSSLSSCPEKRSSKLGEYAGVFFQLFDRSRRLSGKRVLPGDRSRKRGLRAKKDEKLPMAKLLLIANENRGGFPKVFSSDAEDVLHKDKTPEKKNRSRPSVVARLMGLETMPSPEPRKDSKQQAAQDRCSQPSSTPSVTLSCDRNQNGDSAAKTCNIGRVLPSENASMLSHASMTGFNPNRALEATTTKPPRSLVCHKSEDPKITFFCKIPALSPRKADSALRSILSPSKTHNKLLSPIKSPLASKRGARLLEVATKILEPNLQPSSRVRCLGINSQAVSRTLVGNTAELEEQKSATLAPRSRRKPLMLIETKKHHQGESLRVYSDQPKSEGKFKPDKKLSNMQDTNVACKSQAAATAKRCSSVLNSEGLRRSSTTKDESVSFMGSLTGQPRFMRSKSVREDPEHGKSGMFRHNDLKSSKEDKGKPESTRQKQTFNRLNQPRFGTRKRDLCLNTMEEASTGVENKDPNVSTLFNKGDNHKSVSADSVVTSSSSSSILSYGKLFSSRKSTTKHDSARNLQKKGDSSVMKSILRKKAPAKDSLTTSRSKSGRSDKPQVATLCKVKEHGVTLPEINGENNSSCSTLACITEKSIEDNCPEVESGLARSAFINASEVNLKITGSADAVLETCYTGSEPATSSHNCSNSVESNVSSVVACNQSQSLLVEELRDSGSSSYAQLELLNHRRRKAVSYSGKSTAAILQELLMALNSTNTNTAWSDSMQHISQSIRSNSSSRFTLFPQLGDDFEDSINSKAALHGESETTSLSSTKDSSLADDWRHPSLISTLAFSCVDEFSTFPDGVEYPQQRKLISSLCAPSHHQILSERQHPYLLLQSNGCKQSFNCESQYVKDVVMTANLSPRDVYTAKLHLACSVLDPAVFTNLEDRFHQQWEWGIRPYENVLSKCRSETDTHFTKSLYAEAAMQNRKLVFECLHEALNVQLGINERHPRQSPFQGIRATSKRHLAQSVCKQMEEWRSMACCMNIDDMVEQEMNTGIGKWAEFIDEVSDFAVEMELYIVQRLIDELTFDMISSLFPLPWI